MNRTQQILFHTWWVGALVVISSILCMFEVGGCIDRTTHKPLVIQENKPIQPLAIKKDTLSKRDSSRYFLVSYLTSLKSNPNPIHGSFYFSARAMPSKNEIDKNIYEYLRYKRCAYEGIVILYIYEFRDSTDYNNFSSDFKGDAPPAKQLPCDYSGSVSPDSKYWTLYNYRDTARYLTPPDSLKIVK